MKKAVPFTLAVLASAALFIVVFFTSLEWVAFDEGRYAAAQQERHIDTAMGVSRDDLKAIMHGLLQYCRGERSDLNMQYPVNGQMREIFDEREKEHMVDVQKLFVSGIRLRIWLTAGFLACVALLCLAARKRAVRELARGWIVTVSVLGALLAALGIYFATNFDQAWTQFHHVFFTNDLWLLSPDEALIQMLLPLFDGIVQAVIITAAVALAFITALAAFALIVIRKRGSKAQTDAS
jgi:integral membrane protein (TIGR01906 family)